MPWAIPPWRWPSASSGLSTGPASSTVTIRTTTALPDSTSTSTTARWAPNGNEGAPESNLASVRSGSDSASRPSGTETSVPLHPHRAVGHLEVVDRGLQHVRRAPPGDLDQLDRGLVHRDAAGLQAARAHRARAARDEVGVAVLDGDHLDRDSSCSLASIAQAVAWPCPCGRCR